MRQVTLIYYMFRRFMFAQRFAIGIMLNAAIKKFNHSGYILLMDIFSHFAWVDRTHALKYTSSPCLYVPFVMFPDICVPCWFQQNIYKNLKYNGANAYRGKSNVYCVLSLNRSYYYDSRTKAEIKFDKNFTAKNCLIMIANYLINFINLIDFILQFFFLH